MVMQNFATPNVTHLTLECSYRQVIKKSFISTFKRFADQGFFSGISFTVILRLRRARAHTHTHARTHTHACTRVHTYTYLLTYLPCMYTLKDDVIMSYIIMSCTLGCLWFSQNPLFSKSVNTYINISPPLINLQPLLIVSINQSGLLEGGEPWPCQGLRIFQGVQKHKPGTKIVQTLSLY